MKKTLYILGLLSDSDIDWMISVGMRRQLAPGDVLVREGAPFSNLSVILDGRFDISVRSRPIATVTQGEVIGEISLLDSRPPSATVTAETQAQVMSIDLETLHRKLRGDESFAVRLYKALGVFLAQRLRQTNLLLTVGEDTQFDDDTEMLDEIDPEVLEKITLAGTRFKHIVDRLKGG